MRRLIALLLGIAIGGGGMFAAFYFHLVRSDKGWLLVRKRQADWHDAYVDVRGWTHREWSAHRELSGNLVSAGRGDLVHRSMTDGFFRGLFDSFHESQPAPRAAEPKSD